MRNINLLPESYRPAPRFEMKRFLRMLMAGILAVSLVFFITLLLLEKASYEKTLADKISTVQLLEQRVNTVQQEKTELQNLKNLIISIEDIEKASLSKVELLDDLKKHIPTTVNISTLNLSSETITIDGQANNLETVSLLLESLNSWKKYHSFFIPQLNLVEGQYVFQVQGRLRGGD